MAKLITDPEERPDGWGAGHVYLAGDGRHYFTWVIVFRCFDELEGVFDEWCAEESFRTKREAEQQKRKYDEEYPEDEQMVVHVKSLVATLALLNG